jgi:hypothetical protein
MQRQDISMRTWYALGLVWVGSVSAFFINLTDYDFSAGKTASPPWLQNAHLPIGKTPQGHLLVMALHPKCPCSHASLVELQWIVTRCQLAIHGRSELAEVNCLILVFSPENADESWSEGPIVELAETVPNTRLVTDIEGSLAHELNICTSGGVVLYNSQGRPLFHGGITAARGHEGDNRGSEAVCNLILDNPTDVETTPVFGCSL